MDLPTCAQCAHLVGVRHRPEDAENWKCGHENNAKYGETDLVSGIAPRIFKFNIRELRYLNTVESAKAGMSVCGREGKWFKLYVEPSHIPSASPKLKTLADEL